MTRIFVGEDCLDKLSGRPSLSGELGSSLLGAGRSKTPVSRVVQHQGKKSDLVSGNRKSEPKARIRWSKDVRLDEKLRSGDR